MKSLLNSQLSTRAKALYLVLDYFGASAVEQKIYYQEIIGVFGQLDTEWINSAATELNVAGFLDRTRAPGGSEIWQPYLWKIYNQRESLTQSQRALIATAVKAAAVLGPTGLAIYATAIASGRLAESACDWAAICGVDRRTWNRYRNEHGLFEATASCRPQLYTVSRSITIPEVVEEEMIEIASEEEVMTAQVATIANVPEGDYEWLARIADALEAQGGEKIDTDARFAFVFRPWAAQRAKWTAELPNGHNHNFLRTQLHFLCEQIETGKMRGRHFAFASYSDSLLQRQAQADPLISSLGSKKS